jgi:hypothetical protein
VRTSALIAHQRIVQFRPPCDWRLATYLWSVFAEPTARAGTPIADVNTGPRSA